jgi:phenylacetic acid degradation operon negative regulatory protein
VEVQLHNSSGLVPQVDALIARLRGHGLPSVRNLLVTVFGDAVRPHGEAIAVGSLSALLAPLGVTERSVRTSLTRLAGEQLVSAARVGNRSYYGVHPEAAMLYERAEARIYRPPHREWDGRWTFVVVDPTVGDARRRARLRRELELSGLGTIAPNVMASPVASVESVREVAEHVELGDAVLITRAQTVGEAGFVTDADLARRCAPLDLLGARYEEVVEWFTPLAAALADGREPTPPEAFTVRVLLVATYRRVVLADPRLPSVVLPGSWSGHQAYEVVGRVYRALHDSSERHLVGIGETPSGTLAGPAPVAARFASGKDRVRRRS